MTSQRIAERLDDLSLQQSSESDENESCPNFDNYELFAKETREFVKVSQLPTNICRFCFWEMYMGLTIITFPHTTIAKTSDFFRDSIALYEQLHLLFLECRLLHGGSFCVDHFCVVLQMIKAFVEKHCCISWAFASQVLRMYNSVYVSWVRCRGTATKSVEHQKCF